MYQTVDPIAVIAKHQEHLPVNLDGIARDLNVPVRREPLSAEISGKITRETPLSMLGETSGFVIYVNSTQHPNRQRFTLAHEIAHFILHRDLIESGLVDDTLYRSALSSYYETQANRLAADILMPMTKVRAQWAKFHSVGVLARLFGVSEAAMKIRVEAANLNQETLF